jgi:8-oxo-dGTP pyrophosphatase MutT (NUDIX family)
MTAFTSQLPRFPETQGQLRALAQSRLLAAPLPVDSVCAVPSDYDLNPGMPETDALPLKPAAVLIAVVARKPLSVLLTLRTGELGQGESASHAGQIAFPGGKIEQGDADAKAAALREADEEVGLKASFIEPLGYVEPYRTGTGYIVTPVVALVQPGFELTPDPLEVADVFEVPFAFLMDEANHRIDSFVWRGARRHFYAMPYEQRYIWGATAGILKVLHRRLFRA